LEVFGDRPKGRANIQSNVLVPKQRLGFSVASGLGLGDFRFGTGVLGDFRCGTVAFGGQAKGKS